MEELYVEVLYTILHMIGCDIDQVRIVLIYISVPEYSFHISFPLKESFLSSEFSIYVIYRN